MYSRMVNTRFYAQFGYERSVRPNLTPGQNSQVEKTLDRSRPVPVQKDRQRFRDLQIVGLDAPFKMYFSRFLVEQREFWQDFFVLIW